jgi:cytidylate kinase
VKKGLIVTIDGPSGSGKTSVTKAIAERLGLRYIDTGAMYRGIGWIARKKNVPFKECPQLDALLESTHLAFEEKNGKTRLIVDGMDLTDRIRTAEMGMVASDISAIESVRRWLSALQRKLGEEGDTVLEGRDMGTVVFPDADYKFFLTASIEERGRRRTAELIARGEKVDSESVKQDMLVRDRNDSSRKVAPLRKADDAVEIDTTSMPLDVVINRVAAIIENGEKVKANR